MHAHICLEHIKRTTQGKLAAATQRQSAEYLKPLFKLLRSRVSTHSVLSDRSQLTFKTELTSRYACTCFGDRTLHAKTPIPKGKRFLPTSVYWKCALAHRSNHGWVRNTFALVVGRPVLTPSVVSMSVQRERRFPQTKLRMY